MLTSLSQVLQQIVPFAAYLRFRSKKMRELVPYILGQPFREGPVLDAIRVYSHAEPSDLKEALLAEQTRGIALDEKTFKHAASIATALTVASAATTAVAQLLMGPDWKFAVVACSILAIMYVVSGGLLGFGATRTMPTFGVGMRFTIAQNSESLAMKPLVLAEALACQESMNLIRAARNEAAFMSMRNGFLFVVMAVSVVLLGVNFATKTEPVERKIWPASFQSSFLSVGRAPLWRVAPSNGSDTPKSIAFLHATANSN